MQRLARALYPATLADEATLAATDAELDRRAPDDALAPVLLEQRTLLSRAMAARRGTRPH